MTNGFLPLPLPLPAAPAAAAPVATVAFGGPLIPPLGLAILPLALQARGGPLEPARDRFPGIKPGDILRAALAIQALSERGLVPVASTDPFTGDLVVSTKDQSGVLETILGEKFAREALAPDPEEIAQIGTLRDQVVQNLAMPTARQVAPGVVARRSSDLAVGRRIAGPCAAASTGFTRLRCGRGGFT